MAGHAWARPGDLNRCVGSDGHSVYTDKPCDEVGASVRPEAPKQADTSTPSTHVHVRDCASTAEELRDGVRVALVSGDVNKIAVFFNWAGSTTANADEILKRLQTVVARPFVSVDLRRAHSAPDAEGYRTVASAAISDASAIVIVQTHSANDPTPMQTELSLSRYMGCWWIRF